MSSRTAARLASVAVGIWLMAAPAVLGFGGAAADAHRLLGPVGASSAFVAIWPFVDTVKWLTVPVGGLLVLAPLLGFPAAAAVSSVVSGLAFIALAWAGGAPPDEYGGGWRVVWEGRGRRPT